MRLNKNKNTVVLGAAFAALMLVGTQTAAAQKIKLDAQFSVGVDVRIAVDLLNSEIFETLVATKVSASPTAEQYSSIMELDSIVTSALPGGRITHDFIPLPPEYYRTHARIGPARSIEKEDVAVRVVYANPIPLSDTINFHRTKD